MGNISKWYGASQEQGCYSHLGNDYMLKRHSIYIVCGSSKAPSFDAPRMENIRICPVEEASRLETLLEDL